ncbi:energy transducer TonB [Thalassotalea piscium]|uniref:Outer membrane biosynthesis protein TonB n=1 Tax=Thalassotalea piscium TaxID=1230533 RepID=A0A7X0NGV2_9GAMM|nr:energy transducer TonB [Thalassotalea piscium]MBB6543169.1 outer membrane biosynthesis protein TonB [Thalassotalea piscium]
MKKRIAILSSILGLQFSAMAQTNNYADVKLTHLNPEKSAATWIRAKQVTPRYPMDLAIKGIAGCGVFKLTINEDGKSQGIELVSSIPKNSIFKPAKKVIKKWRWKNISGQPNQAEEKTIRLDFCLGGNSEEEAIARCAEQANLKCK